MTPLDHDEGANRHVQRVTIAWTRVELLVAAIAGIRAHSVALTAFAGDSAVELFSAIVVLQRFRVGPRSERATVKVNGVLLYLLAVYIVISSLLVVFSRLQPKPSVVGIVLLIASAIIMPWLGATKSHLSNRGFVFISRFAQSDPALQFPRSAFELSRWRGGCCS